MKALCAIVFVLSSFSIPVQAQNCSETIIEPATMSAPTIAQIVGTEPTVEAADHVMIAKETSVEAIEPSDATQIVERATRSELTDEAIAPSTMPAQIVVTEPTVEELSPADHVMIVDPNAAKETSVEAIEPSDATQIVERATRSELTDDASKPSTMPAQTVATEPALEQPSEADHARTIGATETKEVPLEALQVSDEAQIANTQPGAN